MGFQVNLEFRRKIIKALYVFKVKKELTAIYHMETENIGITGAHKILPLFKPKMFYLCNR